MSSEFGALEAEPRQAHIHTDTFSQDAFIETDTEAGEEVIFNIAHMDEAGVIQYDLMRTTVRIEQLRDKAMQVRQACESYYRVLGHTLLHVQVQVERHDLLAGTRSRPRLRLIQGGLALAAATILAGCMAVSGGQCEWLDDREQRHTHFLYG